MRDIRHISLLLSRRTSAHCLSSPPKCHGRCPTAEHHPTAPPRTLDLISSVHSIRSTLKQSPIAPKSLGDFHCRMRTDKHP
ncbi:hypothetical protein ACS0TY_001562 [Phlomoides rotata]